LAISYAKAHIATQVRQSTTTADENLGRELATRGRWEEELPPCEACHGHGGSGVGASFPPLAAQPASYLVNQLKAWQVDSRAPGPLGLMGAIAKKLSDRDIEAVAQYFSELSVSTSTSQR
jgi:cytochrome c553